MTIENQPPPSHNLPEFTVSELSGALKRSVEETFAHVRVRGEISGFKRHSSGHLYLALKDSEAVLDAVCWRGQAMRLGLSPEDGMEVVATGRLTTYPGRSKYQMVIERMELAGQGALLKLLEDRKRKLAAEGLFAPERKRPIPFLPELIGVVTSPTGAVIRDILHRIRERFPRPVLLWPVAVQGEGAAAQVAAAIRGFNALPVTGFPRRPDILSRPDVLIVARGGGSLEDLWAFNEEIVVRAAAESAIPLISAVGHETDTTLIDYASDLRAPTPTGAAEKAVPVRVELLATTADLGGRLTGGLIRLLAERRQQVSGLARGLPDPWRLLEERAQRLDDRAERLANALPNFLHRRAADLQKLAVRLPHPSDSLRQRRHLLGTLVLRLDHGIKSAVERQAARNQQQALRLGQLGERLGPALARSLRDRHDHLERAGRLLETLSYKATLARGFAVIRDNAGGAVQSRSQAEAGALWQVEFQDGPVEVRVEDGGTPTASSDSEPDAALSAKGGKRAKNPKAKNPGPKVEQGSLF